MTLIVLAAAGCLIVLAAAGCLIVLGIVIVASYFSGLSPTWLTVPTVTALIILAQRYLTKRLDHGHN